MPIREVEVEKTSQNLFCQAFPRFIGIKLSCFRSKNYWIHDINGQGYLGIEVSNRTSKCYLRYSNLLKIFESSCMI